MADLQQWTPADDDLVREALASLARDVDAAPLADVRFVKARGAARRRRTLVTWGAGLAAAAAVVGVVTFGSLGRDTSAPLPPATNTPVPTTTGRPTTTPTPSSPSSPAPGTTAPVALDEDMPVMGVEPLLPSSMFVAASQWSSPKLTGGERSYAGAADLEGSATVIQCETDDFLAGVGGRYGIVVVRAGAGDANVVGQQRVRYFEDVQGYELVQADLARVDALVMGGCTNGANRTTAQRGPVQGTYLLTTAVAEEATGTMYQWVGVTGMQTEGAISTLVFHGTSDGQGFTGTPEEGFAEMLRLMDLARQK